MKCKYCKTQIKDDEQLTQVGLSTIHTKCLNEYITNILNKNKEQKKKNKLEMKKAWKESKKTKALKTAQASFNKYIRKRDEKLGCITCGRQTRFGDRNYHAGHFKSIGQRPDLRFNELNCFGQCAECNLFGSHDIGKIFDKAVKKRIGKKYDSLLKAEHNSITFEYLKEISKKFNKKFRELCTK